MFIFIFIFIQVHHVTCTLGLLSHVARCIKTEDGFKDLCVVNVFMLQILDTALAGDPPASAVSRF